jgi:hypothetical protein
MSYCCYDHAGPGCAGLWLWVEDLSDPEEVAKADIEALLLMSEWDMRACGRKSDRALAEARERLKRARAAKKEVTA